MAEFLRAFGPPRSVLDIPCGTGRFQHLLAEHAESVLALDASLEMLQAASTGSPRLQASAHAVPLVDGFADVVLCSRLLHHFEHPEERIRVLQELARVCTKGVILSYFDRACWQAWRNRVRGRLRGRFPIPKDQFLRECSEAGLIERERRYILRGISEQVWVRLEGKR